MKSVMPLIWAIPMCMAAPAVAATKAPSVVSVLPGNGDRSETPVTRVGITFSGPVKLQSLRVTGPRGDKSQEQILVGDGEAVPLAASYEYPLKAPAAEVGRYEVNMMGWDTGSKTSYSQSFAFNVGTAEQIAAYEEAIEKAAEAKADEANVDAVPSPLTDAPQ
jgi:hypothetical protein